MKSSFYVNQFSALGDSKSIVVDQDENKNNKESSSGQNTEEGKQKHSKYLIEKVILICHFKSQLT